jgi:hypothetical protein
MGNFDTIPIVTGCRALIPRSHRYFRRTHAVRFVVRAVSRPKRNQPAQPHLSSDSARVAGLVTTACVRPATERCLWGQQLHDLGGSWCGSQSRTRPRHAEVSRVARAAERARCTASTVLLRCRRRRDYRSVGARVAPIRYVGSRRLPRADETAGQRRSASGPRTARSLLGRQLSAPLAVASVEVVGHHQLG